MTILLVDSNANLRRERAQALRNQGWTVHEAGNAADAEFKIASLEQLDLLITEAVFDSRQTGFPLRDAVLSRFDDSRTLLTTRYDLAGYEAKVADTPLLIDSPYSIEKLLARVQAVQRDGDDGSDDLPAPVLAQGAMLGDYQIEERLSVEKDAETYVAIQIEVQRPVGLVLLKPERMKDAEAVARFKERERVKASLTHDHVAPLYAAGEIDGYLFYTRELPRGRSIEQMRAIGETLGERAVADLITGVAEAFHYAVERGLHYRNLHARDVYLDEEDQASIVNLFRPPVAQKRDEKTDVKHFLGMVRSVAHEGKARGLVLSLSLEKHDWAGLLNASINVRAELQDRSIMRKIEAEEGRNPAIRRQTTWAFAGVAVAAVVLAILGAGVGGSGSGDSTPKVTAQEDLVLIPGGPFIYGVKDRRKLPDFWISRHEVSIGEYAEFLHNLTTGDPARYDHPEQPPQKTSHIPIGWDEYYAAAKTGASFNGQPIGLDTPVTQVDWWDAHAFAKSRNLRLPTEEEWEKAARGTNGNIYAWGNDRRADAANLGDDYVASGKNGGLSDGYNLWAPVHRKSSDTSLYGVQDMTGNVQEWTARETGAAPWPSHPEFPDIRVPVARGGHFALELSQELLTSRFFPNSAEEATLARGIRTASDSPPSS